MAARQAFNDASYGCADVPHELTPVSPTGPAPGLTLRRLFRLISGRIPTYTSTVLRNRFGSDFVADEPIGGCHGPA